MEFTIQIKMKMLFERIKESDYIVNNYYADNVINKLTSKTDPETQWLQTSPVLSDLLITALKTIGSEHITVQVFVIRVLATISDNELHFSKIFAKEGIKIANNFKKIDTNELTPSLKVACIELALGIAQHQSGISWLLQSEVWKNILNLCSEKQTVFVVRKTYKFATLFLWQLNDLNDEQSLNEVLNVVLKPLIICNYSHITTMSSEEEAMHNERLEPMLQILLSLFRNNKRFKQRTILLYNIINTYNPLSALCSCCSLFHSVTMLNLIAKVVFWLQVAKLFFTKPLVKDASFRGSDIIDLSVQYFNIVQHFVKRRLAIAVLDFCCDCCIIWSEVWPEKGPTMKKTDGKVIELQSQLVVIPLCPIVCYIFTMKASTPSSSVEALNNLDDDCLREYITKLLYFSCEHTVRAAYSMRDLVKELSLTSVVLQCVKRLSCLRNYINNLQANLIFQALFHCLKMFSPIDEYGNQRPSESYEETDEKVIIITYVMETVLLLLKDFNINWQDSIEVLGLYNVVSDIVKKPNLSCRFLVTSLKVIAVTVSKFQPPNLSLLMDSTRGSAINELGNLIYMKLNDRNWEIRDSALELMLVCTEISFIKFPPFQEQIKDNNLIDMAAMMALNEQEVYVQASALKCLGAATKVGSIWEQLINTHPDIQERIISLLRHNQEGIVRKEAASVISEMFVNLKLTPEFKSTLYIHMASAALSDFHWEVQTAALKFWKGVIQTSLADQGMLDGIFPPVTFSKETRKIVTLNENEIQKRLIKCLEELSTIGCLTVLAVLLHEDTETEIMNAALNMSLELFDILKRHKLHEVLKVSESDKQTLNDIVREIKIKNESGFDEETNVDDVGNSDKVIEGIINSTDMNLLASIYENQLSLNKGEAEVEAKPKLTLKRFVTPEMYVYLLTCKDFNAVIESKRQWERGIRSFSSLLDDFLGIYEYDEEVNTMDCY